MPTDQTAICNLALSRLGFSDPITDINEATVEARQCGMIYDQMLEATLRDFPWKFAQKYAELGLIRKHPNPEWTYEFALPSDCITAHKVVPPHAQLYNQDQISGSFGGPIEVNPLNHIYSDLRYTGSDYTIAIGENGERVLWCNQEKAHLLYTSRVTEEGLFDNAFTSAFAWRLAVELAVPLGRDVALKDNAARMYYYELKAARSSSLNETRDRRKPDASFLNVR